MRAHAGTLTAIQARLLHLHAQGLLQPRRRRARRADVVTAIEQMRLLQIDTISVVARSPYLVLHARLGSYPMVWLDEALASGRLAECWAHEACFVPAGDIALHRGWRMQRAHHWAHRDAQALHRDERAGMDSLLEGIRRSGAAKAADYPEAQRSGGAGKPGWWSWKPEKRWLEAWFALGELMIARREGFQRVYDVAENVLSRLDPPFDPGAEALPAAELRQRFILDSARALGVTQAAWIADYYRLKPAVTDKELAPLLADGSLLSIAVRGWDKPAYVHADHADALGKAMSGRLRATHTALLSPFDPVVWDRVRARAVFDFDYALECYTPASKRRYGYFVLPVLHRGRLIGRLDAKAHRAEARFEIKAFYLEPGVRTASVQWDAVALAISNMADWHGTPQVFVSSGQVDSATEALLAGLRLAAR
jgi:uncharacterized protein YcaQ